MGYILHRVYGLFFFIWARKLRVLIYHSIITDVDRSEIHSSYHRFPSFLDIILLSQVWVGL